MTRAERQLLKEIRNALRFLVSCQFNARNFDKGYPITIEEQDREAENQTEAVMKTGSQ